VHLDSLDLAVDHMAIASGYQAFTAVHGTFYRGVDPASILQRKAPGLWHLVPVSWNSDSSSAQGIRLSGCIQAAHLPLSNAGGSR
jgi:hypothetical protein